MLRVSWFLDVRQQRIPPLWNPMRTHRMRRFSREPPHFQWTDHWPWWNVLGESFPGRVELGEALGHRGFLGRVDQNGVDTFTSRGAPAEQQRRFRLDRLAGQLDLLGAVRVALS